MIDIIRFFRPGRFFFIFAILFLGVDFVQELFLGGDFEESILTISDHGVKFYISVIAIAAIETIFVISFYAPGSIVLFTLAVFFSGFPEKLFYIAVSTCFGFYLGVIGNFLMGWFLKDLVRSLGHEEIIKKTRAVFHRYGAMCVFLFSAHPNYIGTLYLAFGLSNYHPKKEILISIVSIPFFIFIWILIIYTLDVSFDQFDSSQAEHTKIISISLSIIGLIFCVYKYFTNKLDPSD